MAENQSYTSLAMDRDIPLGNSEGVDLRRALHVKIKNNENEPIELFDNIRQKILKAQDRVANFTYLDFGTKNQRITQIDYTSATYVGITLQRVFVYSLVGTKYKMDSETWSIV